MTNSEIIIKIAKYAGVYETDEQLFFETLTKKLFEEFKAGDKLKIGDIGFLHLKNIRTSENGKQIKGVVFSEKEEASKNDNVFFLSNATEIFHPDDFCFSYSLKKMEIPLDDEVDMGFFVPPSGKEILSYIDDKVENLIDDCEVIRGSSKDKEIFVIKTEMPGIKVIENLENISEYNSFAQEKEEGLVDSEKFQKIDSVVSGPDEDVDEEAGLNENIADNIISEENLGNDEFFEEKPIIVVKDEENKFELEADEESSDDQTRYNRVKSLSEKEQQKSEMEVKQENEEEKTEIIKELSKPIESDLNPDDLDEFIKKEKKETEEVLYKKIEHENRKTKIFVFLAIIVIVVASLYFMFFYKPRVADNSSHAVILPPSNPVVIERSYDIPVDYPYKPDDQRKLIFDGINANVYSGANKSIAANVTQETGTSNENSEAAANENKIPTVQQGKYKALGDYVFTDGKIYFVQVSSWKYFSSAEKHLNKLKAEGYPASIEKVVSSNGTVYYRVRLGDFNSLEEAKKFIQK